MVKKKCLCWEIRNGSKNVADILQPDLEKSIRTKCYCAEEACAPTLFSKPKECICEEDESSDLKLKRKSSQNLRKEESQTRVSNLIVSKNSKMKQDSVEKVTYENLFGAKDKKTKDYVGKHLSRIRGSNDPYYSGLISPNDDTEKMFSITDFENLEPSTSKITSKKNAESQHIFTKAGPSQNQSHSKLKALDKKTSSDYPSSDDIFSKSKTENQMSSSNKKSSVTKVGDDIMNYLQSMESQNLENDFNQTPKTFSQSMHYNTEVISEPEFLKSQVKPLYQSRESLEKSKIDNFNKFRKDHYFETHSTQDLLTELIPEHVCVHSFSLDDRQFSRPLYGNAYGMSQCIICGKTMKQPMLIKDKEEKNESESFPRFYRYGLAPKKIHLAGDNVRIEMTLEPKDNFRAVRCKRPEYFPNFALRYQKGVAY